MCGICGLVAEGKYEFSSDLLREMTATLRHRGPDDEGFYESRSPGGYQVGLGHRRLSIIDLDTGHQPIPNEDETIWIILNGEIYNFPTLRSELEAAGHCFRTRTDTEVIVHAYEEYGNKCVERLRGMFAFALWDEKRELLLLGRDRVGIKPLYYSLKGNRLAFGSELKPILKCPDMSRRIDAVSLDNFLTFEYISREETILQDIKRLRPGHYLLWEKGKAQVVRYWDLNFSPGESREESYYGERLRELLRESVRMRLVSDVPLGAFLSGGIDSSAVVALMAETSSGPVRTFSIGLRDQSYNELRYARLVSRRFQTEHEEFIIEPEAVELVYKFSEFLDEPFGDFSVFPTFLVSEMARKYVTVVLSGDGGDELFAGYDTYVAEKADRYFRRFPRWLREGLFMRTARRLRPQAQKKGLANRCKRFLEGSVLPRDVMHVRWMTFLGEERKQDLYSPRFREELGDADVFAPVRELFSRPEGADPLSRQMYVDIMSYLTDDILVKVDRMSMANSLETRVPFLDHCFMEFAATIPSDLKLRGWNTKYLLRRAMARDLPPEILKRGKQGFSIPMKNWLQGELREMLLDLLSRQRVEKRGYFNWQAVESLVKEHLDGREDHSHRLWPLLVFELWCQNYIDM